MKSSHPLLYVFPQESDFVLLLLLMFKHLKNSLAQLFLELPFFFLRCLNNPQSFFSTSWRDYQKFTGYCDFSSFFQSWCRVGAALTLWTHFCGCHLWYLLYETERFYCPSGPCHTHKHFFSFFHFLGWKRECLRFNFTLLLLIKIFI